MINVHQMIYYRFQIRNNNKIFTCVEISEVEHEILHLLA